MTTLADVSRFMALDNGLCVVSTVRADGTVQSSLVNAGVLAHPTSKLEVLAFVVAGRARKLDNLRARPRLTAVAHAGWEWAAVEGPVELYGPDDAVAGFDAEALRVLHRLVFTAAGGTHDDWPTLDAVMVAERRTVVMVSPARVYSNS